MNVTIYGATGFVGGYLVDGLLAAGHVPTALVRPGSESKLRSAGRCRVLIGDIADEGAMRAALEGSDAVIYNIGLLREFPGRGITFEDAHFGGVVRAAGAAAREGVNRFLLMSANGVKAGGTPYQDTKYRAEQFLLAQSLDVTIFRPSVIFGDPRGQMEIGTQLWRDVVKPPLPAVGLHAGLKPSAGQIMMSPVSVNDVADAFVAALRDPATSGRIIGLGGPEELSWTEMIRRVAAATGRNKLILPMPVAVMMLAATLFDWLPLFPVTRDQLRMLTDGNTVQPRELAALIGRDPAAFAAANLAYLAAD